MAILIFMVDHKEKFFVNENELNRYEKGELCVHFNSFWDAKTFCVLMASYFCCNSVHVDSEAYETEITQIMEHISRYSKDIYLTMRNDPQHVFTTVSLVEAPWIPCIESDLIFKKVNQIV